MVLVIVAAVWDLRERGRERLVAAALGAGAILLGVLDLTMRIRHLPVVASAIVAVLAGLVVWRAYTGVMRPERPVSERILGAVCVDPLIGLAGRSSRRDARRGDPGGRFASRPTPPGQHPAWRATHTCRSLTLATVGYGDVTPVTPIAGTITWLEAVTGQRYLAITVARLVALSLAEGRGSDTAARR